MSLSLTLWCAVLTFGLPSQLAIREPLDWRVKTPFRLFRAESDWERLRPLPCVSGSTAKCDGSLQDWYSRVLEGRSDPWPKTADTFWSGSLTSQPRGKGGQPRHYAAEYLRPTKYTVVLLLPPAVEGQLCRVTIANVAADLACTQKVPLDVPAEGADITVASSSGRQWYGRVAVTDVLAVGLGDSYASGEGNPDFPAILRPVPSKIKGRPLWISNYRIGSPDEREASWFDDQCHRSLYSHQNLAAMWLAAQDPHRAVTFVHLSCSGAEILDGIVQPQFDPPGGGSLAQGQIRGLRDLLCTAGIARTDTNLAACRPVDLLMLSIGGNDVGFAKYIVHLMAPAKARFGVLTPGFRWLIRTFGKPLNEHQVYGRVTKLPSAYRRLAAELKAAVRMSSTAQVLITEYPTPLFREDGTPCGQSVRDGCRSEAKCRKSAYDFLAFSTKPVFRLFGPWQFQISGPGPLTEHGLTITKVINPLNQAIATAADSHGWTSVRSFVDAVMPHGICAVKDPTNSADELGWSFVDDTGRWTRRDPREWQPYAPHARWFRTLSDSALAQFRNDQRGMLNGAFHPTAREHAEVAQALIGAIR
jgi:hypothetical protein